MFRRQKHWQQGSHVHCHQSGHPDECQTGRRALETKSATQEVHDCRI